MFFLSNGRHRASSVHFALARSVHLMQDNFAHDMIRYDYRSLEPYQALITVNANSDYGIYYTHVMDPLIALFFNLQRRPGHPPPLPSILKLPSVRLIYSHLPFAPKLSMPEYIPTRMMSLVRTLRTHFSRHRLLLSDFRLLPNTIPGVNAPVVQAWVRGSAVACSMLFVRPGLFDIFFPTHFNRLRDMYEHVLVRSRADDDRLPVGHPRLRAARRRCPLARASSLPFSRRTVVR